MSTKKSTTRTLVDLKSIGRRIREIRGFDLTQAEFGRVIGIGQKQLSKYEIGLSAPTVDLLLRLKEHSGKSIDWILTGKTSTARSDSGGK